MQALSSRTAQRSAVAKVTPALTQKTMIVRGAVKCQAQKAEVTKKAAAAVAGLPALVAANPAFALVDDRLNGDGVGLALGVNDPTLLWVIGGVATLIWILYYIGQRDLGDFDDSDSGLNL
eukprot:GHRR01000868.1.p1 GENE.GHRR01000868.1~~GHRR01000868.1.p1  ORF type:complete len:120 (+),score=27.83 GHRR01000868.1:139-498(+)